MLSLLKVARLTAAALAIAATVTFSAPKASAITVTSNSQPVTLINFGAVFASFTFVSVPVAVTFDTDFVLSNISVSGPPFGAGLTGLPCVIGSGVSCVVAATFEPLSVGSFTGQLSITECHNDASTNCHTATIDLKGEGIPRAVETPLPGTLALFATGLGLIGYTVRRRRRAGR